MTLPNRFSHRKTDFKFSDPSNQLPSRRKFLPAGAVGTLGVIGASQAGRSVGATIGDDRLSSSFVQWHLDAIRELQTFGDGSSLPFFELSYVLLNDRFQ